MTSLAELVTFKAFRKRAASSPALDNRPWFDQPNALQVLEQRRRERRCDDQQYGALKQWVNEGYAIVDNMVSIDDIDGMLRDLEAIWTTDEPIPGLTVADVKLREGDAVECDHARIAALPREERFRVRDNTRWRVHGFYRHSTGAANIFHSQKLRELATQIFDHPAEERYSINFMYGSEQRLHQDMSVFAVVPVNYLIGVWIACEDLSPDSGPLVIYPGSHREPMFPAFAVNHPQTSLRTCDRATTEAYHDHLDEMAKKYERKLFVAKKGQALAWSGMVFHGGIKAENPRATRKSYVLHYIGQGMDRIGDLKGPLNW
jgi:phytanoyl-CoA hydroxylase